MKADLLWWADKFSGEGVLPTPWEQGLIDLLRKAAALLAEAPPRDGWQPIETAPKNGTVFNVWLGWADDEDAAFYCVAGSRFSAGWRWKEGRWRPAMGLHLPVVTVQPTHWRPIPSPPKVETHD